MNWDNFYKDLYDATREEKNLLHYQIGYLQGSLNQLKDMIEKGDIKTNDLNMIHLKQIANAYERAVIHSQKHSDEMKVCLEEQQAKA